MDILDSLISLVSSFLGVLFLVLVIAWATLEANYYGIIKRFLLFDLLNPDRSNNILVLFHRAKEEKEAADRGRMKYKKKQHTAKSGIFLGIDLKTEERIFDPEINEGHLLFSGASGTGKTSGLVVPTLLSWKCPFFAIDSGGDIVKNIWRPGIYIYDPCSGYGHYNPFFMVDRQKDFNSKLQQLQLIGWCLIPDVAQKGTGMGYYENRGRKLLIGCLIFFYFNKFSFYDACEYICQHPAEELVKTITSGDRTAKYVYSQIGGFMSSKGLNEIYDDAVSAIDTFVNDVKIGRTLQASQNIRSFTPDLLERSSAIVRVNLEDLDRVGSLIALIISQTFTYFASRPIGKGRKILMMLDEFPALGRVYRFEKYISTLRKYGIRLMLLIQDFPQLKEKYGENISQTILNNCKIIGCLTNIDKDTKELMSYLTPNTAESRFGTSNNDGFGSGVSMQSRDKQAVEAWELSNLGDKQFVFQSIDDDYRFAGYDFLQKEGWYKSSYFKELKKKQDIKHSEYMKKLKGRRIG